MDKLSALGPLELAAEPNWWPLPFSAWLMIGAALIFSLAILIIIVWRHTRHRIKRKALRQLVMIAENPDLPSLDNLLRRVALTYYPRREVASLTGESWLKWLDDNLAGPHFLPLAPHWYAALYRGRPLEDSTWQACIEASQRWITQLKPEARC